MSLIVVFRIFYTDKNCSTKDACDRTDWRGVVESITRLNPVNSVCEKEPGLKLN